MAHDLPDVLKVFADRYRASQAGRTGVSSGDFTLDYMKLLKAAGAQSAAARSSAEERLRAASARSQGMLKLDTHARDERLIHIVRLSREGGEQWLFRHLHESSPTEERRQLADLFGSFADTHVPQHQQAWSSWCRKLAQQVLDGTSIAPFARDDLEGNRELLTLLPRVLGWQGESLIRFASCSICRSSKRLEELRPRIELALKQLSNSTISSLEDLGLMEKPRQVFLCGPLLLQLPEGPLNLGLLKAPVSLSETDIRRAVATHCTASRVLTVENETTFMELTKLGGDTLFIQTSYPGRAVLALLARLPASLPIHHFGDSDPAGFDILRDLRERSGRAITPLHMRHRPCADSAALQSHDHQILGRLLADPHMADCHAELQAMQTAGTKGDFEQESLGPPSLTAWPFYR
ncbi:Wadjet anti-phage system protein JetD domain-containing protein [Prosthecobacter fluviatilis]|uniref:Wadjet anti-phage system protein JetD domain-containing protein n=1 Tax=Prosthecobacter fluviatilis TaxID=445931 RepID=A0ABW0KUQ1_9BACT